MPARPRACDRDYLTGLCADDPAGVKVGIATSRMIQVGVLADFFRKPRDSPLPHPADPKRVTLEWLTDQRTVIRVRTALTDEERGKANGHRSRTELYPRMQKTPLRDVVLYNSFTGRQYSDSPRAVHEELVARGLITAQPPKGEGDDAEEEEEFIPWDERPPVFAEKLRLLFDATHPRVTDVETQAVWAAGEVLRFGGNFNTYITSKDLAKQEALLVREIFGKAGPIIQTIAKRDGYTMILEKNEGAVLWAEGSLDITAEVNKKLM